MEKRTIIKNIFLLAIFTVIAFGLNTPVSLYAWGGVSPLVSTSWLDKHKGDKNVVLIDVRTEANYGFAHIPNAVSIPYGKLEPKCAKECYMIPPTKEITRLFQNAGVNKNSHVVVYAHGNTTSDASKAAAAYWVLKAMGHKKVSMLNGGFTKWTFEGRVVTNEVPKVKKGNFQAKRNPAAVADFSEVAKVVQKGGAVLVDARNSVQYFGHEKRMDVTCYGHIPGAINLPADFLNNSGVNRAPATIKDEKDLATMVVGVGIPKAKSTPIIVYCNTAQLAGLNYLVLKDILGYQDVKVYDGSMLEYCKVRGKLPVERFSWSIGSLRNL
ncbi:MAG: sulfurtransferase [Thermodesulfobacteria bacterium]|nr:sulfurtransferase [Thermodesulfobacteriota bacterium]